MKTQHDSKETNKTGAAAFMEGARDKLDESEVVKTAIAIPLNKIRPNPNQPRKTFDKGPLNELSADIKMRGVREPITVTKINDTESDILFEIVKGERRWRASGLAGLTEIPAFIEEDLDEGGGMIDALLENIQRENLNFMDTMNGYVKLRSFFGEDAEGVAKRASKDKSTIAKYFKWHSDIYSMPDIAALFEKQTANINRATAESFAKVVTDLRRLQKANKREYDRIYRRFEREGIQTSVPGLVKKFVGNKNSAGDASDKRMFRETAQELSLVIKLRKGAVLDSEMEEKIRSDVNTFLDLLNTFPKKGEPTT